jgi:dienelactone hydrolase
MDTGSARAGPGPETLLALLGGFPPAPPLEPSVLAVDQQERHTRKLVEYATEEGERVQAFLLVPRDLDRPAPGVLAIHQDGGTRPYAHGKSEPAGVGGDPELAYGRELCERGYVVLCPDRFGFESRSLASSPSAGAFARFRIFKEDGLELTEDLWLGCVANRLLHQGRVPLGRTLFELRRAVDYLCAQPEVLPARIGVIGHSAGGFYGALAMYLDDRIGVGCASCGTFLFRWSWGLGGALRPINGFAGATVPGMARWGDVDDVLAGLAPRPFLETQADGPYFTPEELADLTGKARERYAALGAADRYEYVAYDGGHAFRADMRERSYAWFDRWLRA